MAQLLVFFATSKCSPHVIKWFEQTSPSAHVNVLYVPENSALKHMEKTNWTVIPVEPLLLSPKTNKQTKKKPKRKLFVHLFLRRGSHESWRTWTRNLKQIKTEGKNGEDTTTLSRFQRFLAECDLSSGTCSDTRVGEIELNLLQKKPNQSNILLDFPKSVLKEETPMCCPNSSSPYRWLQTISHLKCRVPYKLKVWMFWDVLRMCFTVLRFNIVHGSHTSDRLEAKACQRAKLGHVQQPSLFLAG